MTQTAELFARPGEETAPDAEALVRQVAHELRQPLSTIESIAYYLDMILPRDDPRTRKQLQRLERLVEQSNAIVSNAVILTRTSPPQPRISDPAELIASAIADGSPGAAVEIESSGQPVLIRIDPMQGDHLFRAVLLPLRILGSEVHPVKVQFRSEHLEVVIQFSTSAPGHTTHEVQAMFSGLSQAGIQRVLDAHSATMEIAADLDTGVMIRLRLPA